MKSPLIYIYDIRRDKWKLGNNKKYFSFHSLIFCIYFKVIHKLRVFGMFIVLYFIWLKSFDSVRCHILRDPEIVWNHHCWSLSTTNYQIEWSKIKDRNMIEVISQYDKARPHVAKTVQEALQVLNWEILPYPPYWPDIAPSGYYLYRSIHSTLLGERFSSCEKVTKWVDQWIASKETDFLSRNTFVAWKWENVVLFNGKYFEWNIFYFTI